MLQGPQILAKQPQVACWTNFRAKVTSEQSAAFEWAAEKAGWPLLRLSLGSTLRCRFAFCTSSKVTKTVSPLIIKPDMNLQALQSSFLAGHLQEEKLESAS